MKIDLDPVVDGIASVTFPIAEKVLVAAFCIGSAVLDGGYWQAFCGGDIHENLFGCLGRSSSGRAS